MNKKKLEKIDYFFIIFGVILVVLTILFIIFPEWGSFFNLGDYADPETVTYDLQSGLIIVGVSCVLGALVPFPVPYTIVVAIVAKQFWELRLGIWSIFIMIIIATITNSIGDFIDWLIGYYGGKLSKKKKKAASAGKEVDQEADGEKQEKDPENKWARIVYKKPALIPFLLILFGVTPLPDSLLFMPLGVINYSLKKTMLWNAVGKLIMMIGTAFMGIWLFDVLLLIPGLGGGGDDTYGWVTGMVVLAFSWILMYIMTRD
jgi:membrane protein YqaA with SNARE-associated domain